MPQSLRLPMLAVVAALATSVCYGQRPPIESLLSQQWYRKAPSLPRRSVGRTVEVRSVQELVRAIETARPGDTINIADGHYFLPRYVEIRADNVTIRGASGDRTKVVLDGARSMHGELLGITNCSGVTVAHLTVQNVRWNAIKINSDKLATKVAIYDCVIHNVWQRGIKGPRVPEHLRDKFRPADCTVQYCLFYNDRPKQFSDDPADRPDNFNGNYIGGIDVMFAKRWIIADNVFVGIRGRTGEGRGAIFLWHESEDCIVERNVIIDCDSGICLGNSYRPADIPVHCRRVTVRNNFVTRCHENGILADYTSDCVIVHNTIFDPASPLKRLIRMVHDNKGLIVANNLLVGPPIRVETHDRILLKSNLAGVDMISALVDPLHGNLHLRQEVPAVVDQAAGVYSVPDDIDARPRHGRADIGADEFAN